MLKSRFITLATAASLGASVLVAPVTVQAATLTNENDAITATLDEREQAGLEKAAAAGAEYYEKLLDLVVSNAEELFAKDGATDKKHKDVFPNSQDDSIVEWNFKEIVDHMLNDDKFKAIVKREAQKMATDPDYAVPSNLSDSEWATAQRPYNMLLSARYNVQNPLGLTAFILAAATAREVFDQVARGEKTDQNGAVNLTELLGNDVTAESILIIVFGSMMGVFYNAERDKIVVDGATFESFWGKRDDDDNLVEAGIWNEFAEGEGDRLFSEIQKYEEELQQAYANALEGETEYGLPEADPEDAGGTDETGEQGGTSDDSDDVDDKDDENSDDSEESDDSDSDDTELTDDETDGDGNGAGESDGSEDTDETLDETGDTDGEESEGEDDSSEIHDRNQVILGGVGLVASLGLGILSWLPIPGIKELNTAIQKQIGVFNPALAGFANNATGIVGGLGSLIGLVVSALSIFNGVTGRISTKKIETSAQ